MTDYTLAEATTVVKASFAKYQALGIKPWTWEIAARDLTLQVGSMHKVLMQMNGERYDHGKSKDQLRWQLSNELADILAETLYIAGELGIDMNQALEEMVADDTNKVTQRLLQ